MALLIEHMGAELGCESLLKKARLDKSFSNEECHVGSIACAVPAKLREDEIVDFEGTKPKVFEASRSHIDEPGSVGLRELRDRHAVEAQSVFQGDLASLAGDAQENLPRLRRLDVDEIDVRRGPRQLPKYGENEASQAVDFDGPVQGAIHVPEEREPWRLNPSRHRADVRP